ncbi:MAG TPA: hypothetical protein DIT64_14615 [Verrucomicrobiales bacterium]|nr:hypothetical protein [Verrucomicrobiales bacterium]
MTPSLTLFIGLSMCAAGVFGADVEIEPLRTALRSQWTELTVSEMIDQGCVAPIYIGLRLTRTQTGITIAAWQQDQKGEKAGATSEFDLQRLSSFIEALTTHYAVAVTSEDIHEHIAKLKTEDERMKEWARVIKAAGGLPVGGFGAVGIDIRIKIDGRSQRFENSYGAEGFDQLQKWLAENGTKYQDK